MTSKKQNKTRWTLNYLEHKFFFISTVSGCVSISAFASLVGIPIQIKSSSIGLKICAIPARIKEFKSIIKKNMKKYGKIVLLVKTKLNAIEVLLKF